MIAPMTNDIANERESSLTNPVRFSWSDPQRGVVRTHDVAWIKEHAPIDLEREASDEAMTPTQNVTTVAEPSAVLSSETPFGREVLRDRAARGGESFVPLRKSRLGLDLAKFAAHVVSQPARSRHARATRNLGPMQVDARVVGALDVYARAHNVSKRQVVECLLRELLADEIDQLDDQR